MQSNLKSGAKRSSNILYIHILNEKHRNPPTSYKEVKKGETPRQGPLHAIEENPNNGRKNARKEIGKSSRGDTDRKGETMSTAEPLRLIYNLATRSSRGQTTRHYLRNWIQLRQ